MKLDTSTKLKIKQRAALLKKKFISFLKNKGIYDDFIIYLKEDDKHYYAKTIDQLVITVKKPENWICFAFNWDKPPGYKTWRNISAEWADLIINKKIVDKFFN